MQVNTERTVPVLPPLVYQIHRYLVSSYIMEGPVTGNADTVITKGKVGTVQSLVTGHADNYKSEDPVTGHADNNKREDPVNGHADNYKREDPVTGNADNYRRKTRYCTCGTVTGHADKYQGRTSQQFMQIITKWNVQSRLH